MTPTKTPTKPTTLVVIESTSDAAYTHGCRAMVSPVFTGSGRVVHCPRCGKTV